MSNEKPTSMNRRSFIATTGLAAASFTIVPRWVLGGPGYTAPSDQIGLGYIGLGRRGFGLGKSFAQKAEVRTLAACDVDSSKLKRFQQEVVGAEAQTRGNSSASDIRGYEDFEGMLQQSDIDAVVIATPDHWHALPAIMAMKAGKDVYCEKPMAHTIKEGRAMVKAARKYDRVFQTGSQQRSSSQFLKACELVRNGYVGEIKQVKVSLGEPAIAVPCDLPPQETPDYLNWDKWCGSAEVRPYHFDLAPPIPEPFFPKWRHYKEFGLGMLGDWGAHMIDIAQWGLGMDESGPVEFIPPADPKATQGMIFRYANGVEMIQEDFGRGRATQFIGSKGTLTVSRGFLDSDPASLVEHDLSASDERLYKSEDHLQDWLDCLRTRQRPICDVETGHRSASVCIIANIAYWLQRPLTWNPEKEKFVGDGEANKLRKKDYRKPWKV